MDIEFKTKNDKQIEAAKAWLDADIEQILYGGAKGGGKSFLGASLIFGDALIYPGTHYFIARKELIDLRNFTIPTIHEVFKKWKLDIKRHAPYNGQDHRFNLRNGSIVHLIACADEPGDPLFERFGSMQMTRGWEEEAGEIPENAHANLWLSIGRWRNVEYKLPPKLLITANPKKGWMKRDFVDPEKQGLLAPSRKYIQAFASDNTYLPPSYEQKLKADTNKVRRQRLAEGNWDYDDDQDSLITYDSLSDAFTNTIANKGDKYIIADVARLGRDSTIFTFWRGLELYRIEERQRQDTAKTEEQMRDFAAIEKTPFSHILIDEDGIGGGVVDHLVGVKGFTANSTPYTTAARIRQRIASVDHEAVPKTVFGNLKAQCGWKIAELINEHKVRFNVPDYRERIMEELTAMLREADVGRETKKYLRPKEKVKEEIGHSPDIGDCIVMRALFEIRKDVDIIEDAEQAEVVEEQTIRLHRNARERKQGSRSNK